MKFSREHTSIIIEMNFEEAMKLRDDLIMQDKELLYDTTKELMHELDEFFGEPND
jgi:hypothetical protein